MWDSLDNVSSLVFSLWGHFGYQKTLIKCNTA